MLRYSELLLLLPPFVLAYVWLRTGSMPTRRLLISVLAAVLAIGGVLAWYGNDRAVQGVYVPPHSVDGRVVPGHGS